MNQQYLQRREFPAYRRAVSGIDWPRWPVRSAALAAMFSVSGVSGCGDTAGELPGSSSNATVVRVPIIRNVLGDAPAGAWTVGRELRVGSADGENAFGRVVDVAPRGAGGMWVLDAQSMLVSGFDEHGGLVLRFGGEGQGPGELPNASRVFETTAGRVAVGSPFPPMIHWFETDGSYVESARITESRDTAGKLQPPRFGVWNVSSSGRAFADLFAVPGPGAGPTVSHDIMAFRGDGASGAKRDTVVSWEVAATPADFSAPLPIVPVTPKWTTGPGDLVWWTPGSPYEIHAYELTGKLAHVITLDRDAVPVTGEVRELIADGLRRSAGRGPGGIGLVENALSRAKWPDVLPQLAGLWVSDPDGRVFTAPYSASSFDPGAPIVLDVFEPDGGFSGSLRLPPAFSPKRFAGGFVYGVATDDLGVTFAVRYAIERSRAVTP